MALFNIGKKIPAESLYKHTIGLTLKKFYFFKGERLLMMAMRTSERLAGHQQMIFADNFFVTGPAMEADTHSDITIWKTDTREYFHFFTL